MNSRVSWSVDGIDPSVRERAEAAARRAGMSLNDWLNSTVGEAAPPNFRYPVPPSQDVADIHQRLDAITRQIEQMSRPTPRNEAGREQGVARQLNDAISRLDARLSQISNPQVQRQAQERQQEKQQRRAEAVERAANQVYPQQGYAPQDYSSQDYSSQGYSSQGYPSQHYPSQGQSGQRYAPQSQTSQGYRPSPPQSPASLDFAVAEIAARQSELDNPPPRQIPPRQAQYQAQPPQVPPVQVPPIAPAMPQGPDFSSLERHLIKITSQIEALQRPDHLEQSIKAFRSELAEIRSAIMEAMPRRAIESIESEIRSLSRRIDDNRQSGIEPQALAGVERALSDIRQVLSSLMSAEQLAGYDEAIRALGGKLDMILRANDDPGAMQQLENAITALRAIVSNVASNDALARLSEDVHLLSSKVDQLTRTAQNGDSFAGLEQRIADLASVLESRERPVVSDNSERIEGALRSLSDRIDRLQVGNDGAAAIAHLEQRVSYLLERLDSSGDHRSDNLGRVEDALQDVLRHLERQHASIIQLADSNRTAPQPQEFGDPGLIDLLKRELSDIRFSQTETERHTQDSLEAVHSTLGHVVDRLAMIEGDLRTARTAPPTPQPVEPQHTAAPIPAAPSFEEAPRIAIAPQPQSEQPKPELFKPELFKPELPNPAALQVEQPHFVAAPRDFHAAAPPVAPSPAVPTPPLAISEILLPHSGPARPAIEPDLPPDHPLEPGTRPSGRTASPSERIAASESAISEIPAAAPKEPVSSSSFIAAARRAAQAAAAQPLADIRAAEKKAKDKARDGKKDPSGITSKLRSVLVAASVVVIVLGTFKMAMTLLENSATPPPAPASDNSSVSPALPPADNAAKPATPDQITPSMTSPTPIGRQSFNDAAPSTTDAVTSVEIPQAAASPTPSIEITGTIPTSQPGNHRLASIAIPPTEKLPDAIGGTNLRTAALKGDPTAAYEIAVRFAEGKGVPPSLEDAAKWYDRAAQAGVIPAVFRLGTFYEKGMGVKKDVDIARRYYVQAAERGNAKAMHNLAVLDADGGGKGANYTSAAQWFRKAADRGVPDSEFNLGILYARGIGVDQNLAESYKWFSLAAAQGDADAGRKRDDVAKRVDAQSLAAAKLAIQTFTAEPQPDDAVTVATPPGGWDGAPAQAIAKPAAKPAIKRAPTTARL
jgi:localization factor PodJL